MIIQNTFVPILDYTFSTFLNSWGKYFWPIIFISTFLILLVYLVAKIMQSKEYEARVNLELNDIFYAVFAVFITLSLMGIGEIITTQIIHGTSLEKMMDPSSPTSFKTDSVARNVMSAFTVEMYSIMTRLYYLKTCYALKNLVMRRNSESVLMYSYKIFPGSDMFVSLIDTLNLPLTMAYSSVASQVILLHILDLFVIYVTLPLSIIMRFIPSQSVKQAASFLLAFSVGALIVFPMTYVFVSRGILDIITNNHPKQDMFPFETQSWYVTYFQCGAKQLIMGTILNAASNLFSIIPKFGKYLSILMDAILYVGPSILELSNPLFLWGLSRYIGFTFVIAVFIPTLATILTTSFISAYSKYLMSM